MTRVQRWRAPDGVLRVIVSGLRSTRGDGSTAARIERDGARFRAVVALGASDDTLCVGIGSEEFCAGAAELWLAQNAVGAWPNGGVVIEGTRDAVAFKRAMTAAERSAA